MSFNCPFCNAPIDARARRCPSCDSAVPALLPAGEIVGARFQVLSVLGAGPLGATYRVRDNASGHELALKAIAEELCPTDRDRAGFVSRVEMFAGRTIAGCAMPLEVGADARFAYVTTPLIDGVTLRSVLGARAAARQQLSAEEALRVMLSLAASASALHSATPHGALRPENIVVTSRGLILTDCVIAVALAADKLQPRVKTFARALPYVSPEAAAGKRVTATADLFALGAIGAELLAGSPHARALDHAQLPAEVATALRTLLDRDPTRRPGAVGALLDALSRACGFERRPADAPLPVPAVPEVRPAVPTSTVPPATSMPSPRSMPVLASPPAARPETSVTRAGRPGAAPIPSRAPSQSSPPPPREPSPPSAFAPPPFASSPPAFPPPAMPRSPGRPPSSSSSSGSIPRLPPMPVASPSRAPIPAGPLPGMRPVPPALPPLTHGASPMRPAAPPQAPSKPSLPPTMPRSAPSIPRMPAMPSTRPSAPAGRPSAPPARAPGAPARRPERPSDAPPGEGIDPRLLRAARKLESDPRNEDTGEVDLRDVSDVDD